MSGGQWSGDVVEEEGEVGWPKKIADREMVRIGMACQMDAKGALQKRETGAVQLWQ